MAEPVQLRDVFGVRVDVDPRSYVNRGKLDERLSWLLEADRHIIIHGDSKQGKSWLRAKRLSEDEVVVVQCQPGATREQILTEALSALGVRAEISAKSTGGFEGSLEISSKLSVGAKILAALGLEGKGTAKATKQTEVDTAPIGRTPADINWVARVLKASERRLVIEDFHYVSEETRRQASFLIKSLGDRGVFVLVVGIWPQDYLLSHYNNDLEGRLEDIHLRWSPAELETVLEQGAGHLGISFSPGLRESLTQDSYGNVGLLQRLAEALCREEGITQARDDFTFLTVGSSLEHARASVADSMRGRYESFTDKFVMGLRRLSEGHDIYKHLLKVVTDASDVELEAGLPITEVLNRMNMMSSASMTLSGVTRALEQLDRLQAVIDIKPPVLSYTRDFQRVWVVDKSFLFFRKHGTPNWPWCDPDFDLVNDLAASNPLNFAP